MEQDTVVGGLDRAAAPAAEYAPQIEEELLIEEISIDGMCGVY